MTEADLAEIERRASGCRPSERGRTLALVAEVRRLKAEARLLEEALTDALKTRREGRVPEKSSEL